MDYKLLGRLVWEFGTFRMGAYIVVYLCAVELLGDLQMQCGIFHRRCPHDGALTLVMIDQFLKFTL